MKARYTKRAARDLDSVLAHIERFSPHGAKRVKDRLFRSIELIAQFPLAGRLINKREMRRITAFPYPYVIYYSTSESGITVHGVRHTARKPVAPTRS